ncbi:MAG: hypothetical protein C3F14_02155 [Deltaproteobacteria bacterium]|nr:MAG: hypothetical protein C3F14_02155 [Deltaproteobacteria bacterium]
MPSWIFRRCLLVLLFIAVPVSGWTGESAESGAAPPEAATSEMAKVEAAPEEVGQAEAKAEGGQRHRRLLILPFPFYNETIGPGLGVGVIADGYIQPRAGLVVASLVSSSSFLVYVKLGNLQVPVVRRLLFEPDFEFGKLRDIHTYTGTDNPGFPGERAGSNESDKNNFKTSDGDDKWVNLYTKFLLPIGQGKESILPRIRLERGLPVSDEPGSGSWNPLVSGRSWIEVTPFMRKQTLEDGGASTKTAGIEAGLRYDRTDFRANPTQGSMLRGWVTRDWGALDSTAPYTVAGGEYGQYFPLGPSDRARQRVIAFDLWTVNCLTWDASSVIDGTPTFHRPPPYKGATLGGLERLRAYPAARFNDKAGILYTLEYRYILDWNPLKNVTLNGRLQVDWFEIVGFGELGRVAPNWTVETLHKGMKADGGIGVRSLVNNVVVRVDMAAGPEGWATQMFVGQPF